MSGMTSTQLREHAIKALGLSDYYVKDLDAMSEELLAKKPGGVARSALDFTYEVVVVNRMFADIMKSRVMPDMNREGWIMAPEGWTKDEAINDFKASVQVLVDVLNELSDEDLVVEFAWFRGDTCAYKVALVAATHLNYHCAQLNYLQALNGDNEMHWM